MGKRKKRHGRETVRRASRRSAGSKLRRGADHGNVFSFFAHQRPNKARPTSLQRCDPGRHCCWLPRSQCVNCKSTEGWGGLSLRAVKQVAPARPDRPPGMQRQQTRAGVWASGLSLLSPWCYGPRPMDDLIHLPISMPHALRVAVMSVVSLSDGRWDGSTNV